LPEYQAPNKEEVMKYTPNGIYTAIVTPFTKDDEFDEKAFRKVVDFQIESGIHGLLVIGGSGEFVSLTRD
jgi:4-hydroxy-tetrahydrodipicolinate synthase